MRRRLVVANAAQTWRRFRFLFVALGVGMVLLLATSAVVGDALSASARQLDEGSELSVLELLSVSPAGEPAPLTDVAISDIAGRPGVQEAIGAASIGVSLEPADPLPEVAEGLAGAFWVMPRFGWSQPPTIVAAPEADVETLRPGQVLLPDRMLGVDLSPLLGQDVQVEYIRRSDVNQGVPEVMALTVVGLYDADSPSSEGDGAAYASVRDFERVYAALLGSPQDTVPPGTVYPRAWVKAESVAAASALAAALTRDGYYVQSGGRVVSLSPALQALRQATTVAAVLLAMFGAGIGMSMSGTWSHLRRWDIGLLTSLGWSAGAITRAYVVELALVGVGVGGVSAAVGGVVSLLASALLPVQAWLGAGAPGAGLPAWPWLAAVTIGTPVVLVLGALPRLLLLSRMPPDEALRRPS